jgi:uncharacterized protein YcbK (DUF882 family)
MGQKQGDRHCFFKKDAYNFALLHKLRCKRQRGQTMNTSKRQFLLKTLQISICCLLPGKLFAATAQDQGNARSLSFYNLHTGETLNTCYFRSGEYLTDSLTKIDLILRDHRSGEVRPIDRQLLDLLFALSQKTDPSYCFHIISGYRSPASNARLRTRSRGVAGGSLHMKGKAVDIRVPGYATDRLHRVCREMKAGGVGYYPRSDFVHIDTGRIRYWGG